MQNNCAESYFVEIVRNISGLRADQADTWLKCYLLQSARTYYYKVRQLFYYKVRQVYYKVRQVYYKVRQVLQSGMITTKFDSTLDNIFINDLGNECNSGVLFIGAKKYVLRQPWIISWEEERFLPNISFLANITSRTKV